MLTSDLCLQLQALHTTKGTETSAPAVVDVTCPAHSALQALPAPIHGEKKRAREACAHAFSAQTSETYLPSSRNMHNILHGQGQPDLLQLGCENLDQPLALGHEGVDQPLALGSQNLDQPLALCCEKLDHCLALGHEGFDLPLFPGYQGFDLPLSLAQDLTLQGSPRDLDTMDDEQHLLLVQVSHL